MATAGPKNFTYADPFRRSSNSDSLCNPRPRIKNTKRRCGALGEDPPKLKQYSAPQRLQSKLVSSHRRERPGRSLFSPTCPSGACPVTGATQRVRLFSSRFLRDLPTGDQAIALKRTEQTWPRASRRPNAWIPALITATRCLTGCGGERTINPA